jgi:Zn finger protein HypA/HybF involved in hydrogenase expression
MDDLISRKALLEKAWEADTQCGYVQVVDVGDIEDAPVVDAAPVVHGRWGEYESFPLTPSMNGCPCSVCKTHFSPSSIILMKYCPNCGAKMDGGNDSGKAD